MKLRAVIAVFVIVFGFAGQASAWLNAVSGGLKAISGGGQSASADPDAFLAKARKVEALVEQSAGSLFKAVASKEEQAKHEELQKKLNETTDDKEKNALRQQLVESEIATIEKRAKDEQVQQEAKKWDENKKKQVAAGVFNLGLAGLQALPLVSEGTSIATSISNNPVNAVKLALKLNSVIESGKAMSGIISNTASVVSAMKPLMSAADIEVKTPSSATDTPRDASGEI